MVRTQMKKERHKKLMAIIESNPFIKDDELAGMLNVSVATIRTDRRELGINEYRERIQKMAKNRSKNNTAEIVDMELFHDGVSIVETKDAAVYEGTDVRKGQEMFGIAEDLALNIINTNRALICVANVKYIKEVHRGERLIAKIEVVRTKNSEYIVWVKMRMNRVEVFRSKFKLSVKE